MSEVDLINEETKLIKHRLMARKLLSDPGMIDRARTRLQFQESKFGETDFIQEWKTILELDLGEIRQRMVARDQDSYRLRISSPFNTISGLPFADETLRRRIWRSAKRLVKLRLSKPDGWNKWLDLRKFEHSRSSQFREKRADQFRSCHLGRRGIGRLSRR